MRSGGLKLAFSLVSWLTLGVLLLGFSAAAPVEPSAWTASQWAAWRDQQISSILEPTYETGGERVLDRKDVITRCAQAYEFLAPLLRDGKLLADPARQQALGNFTSFVTAQHWMALKNSAGQPTHKLGMDVSDQEYWSFATAQVNFPELLQSQEFLQLVGDPRTYRDAVALIEAHNRTLAPEHQWVVMPFRSQFIQCEDHVTYGRLLVLVPGERISETKVLDRWVLIAIATPELTSTPAIRAMQMIAVTYDPAQPGTSEARYYDCMRQRDPASGVFSIVPAYELTPSPSTNCYGCHKSAVMQIRPAQCYKFDALGALVDDPQTLATLPDQLNDRLPDYGISDLVHVQPAAYGPSLGEADRQRSDAFIAAATADHPVPQASYAKLRDNLGCADCHDSIGQLNYLLAVRSSRDSEDFMTKQGLLQTYVEQGYMPPGNNLTPAERHALWECLVKEYYDPATGSGTFVDWLKGQR